ncbi:MAG TPA: DUF481 domain-containing protein [Thermoanaerobaculia bacterium]|nr:DUF481 domain-containing protein [Thermoanaerobaculia bacterium]
MRLRTAFPVAGLLSLFLAAPARAQKTDVIVLFNGDRVTCEIRSYSSGRLSVKTDIASDINVKWNKIVSITSDKDFEIETTDGFTHYGHLTPSSPPGKLAVVSDAGTDVLSFMDVVRISPMYESFWRRWQGSLDLGFNYTQANDFVQFTFSGSTDFRRPTFELAVSLSVFFTSQSDVPSNQRASFLTQYEKYLPDRWLVIGFGGVDRNVQLGLDWRYSLGAAYGRELVSTNQTRLVTGAGLVGMHEEPVSGDSTNDLAAIVAAQFSHFTYDFPKVTIGASLSVIPYLTQGGRVRVNFNGSVKREIARDFYLTLSIFDDFDNRDPSTGQAKNDWGPVLSIGYSF